MKRFYYYHHYLFIHDKTEAKTFRNSLRVSQPVSSSLYTNQAFLSYVCVLNHCTIGEINMILNKLVNYHKRNTEVLENRFTSEACILPPN